MWFCLYDIIFPGWYFQGIEQMKWITYISLIMRLTFVGLIYFFIKKQSDFLLVPILNGVGSMIAGSVALFIIYKKHQIKFKFQSYKTLKYYFKKASPIFLSNISSSAITSTTKVIIGLYLGMAETAYFDLADKITNILKTPQFIFSQIVLPKITREKSISFVKKLRNYSFIANTIMIILIYMFINSIIFILGGKQMLPAKETILIMLLTVPFSALMSVYGVQMLIPFGFSKLYTKIIFTSGLIYIFQIAFINYTFGITLISLSIVTLITEVITVAIAHFYCKKNIFNNLLYN
jgi:PST family polysaccharide transporter